MSAKETKEKILKCTTELILERGGDISNVTIRTIAARAGIGVGLTNHYFSSKEQLIEECIASVFSELFEQLAGNGIGTAAGIDRPDSADDLLKADPGLPEDIGNGSFIRISETAGDEEKNNLSEIGELGDEKDDLLAGLLESGTDDEDELSISLQETVPTGNDELTAGLTGTETTAENGLSSGLL